MAITSVGYAGTVDDVEWPLVTRYAGGATYNVAGPADFNATPGVGDRAVAISAGVAAGAGVVDTSDGPVTLLLPSVASGDRWDLIGLQRHWATGISTVVRVAGGTSKALPSRSTTPGVEDVQPLWLLRVRAGQTTVQEYVDLRVWVGDGGAYANDDLVRSYMDRVGTLLRVGSAHWVRRIDSTGAAVWESATADGGWTTISTLGSGWTATPGHPPRIRRVGDRVEIAGAVMTNVGANYANILTIPVGFRLGGAYTNYFVGGVVTSDGSAHQLFLNGTNHRIQVPDGYYGAPVVPGDHLPLCGSWFVN